MAVAALGLEKDDKGQGKGGVAARGISDSALSSRGCFCSS